MYRESSAGWSLGPSTTELASGRFVIRTRRRKDARDACTHLVVRVFEQEGLLVYPMPALHCIACTFCCRQRLEYLIRTYSINERLSGATFISSIV
jgi:hypothetical protein